MQSLYLHYIMDQTFFLEQQNMPTGALYVVGTPIGNLADITYRAVYILKNVDGIACEDTRHTSHLLNTLGIHKPLLAIHEHNEIEASHTLIDRLKKNERWAYLCDAGTPGVSDPGARLTNEVQRAGLQIIPIPGPSALTALVSVAGQINPNEHHGFQFLGFLPLKGKERLEFLRQMDKSPISTVFYEAPGRVVSTLLDLHREIKDPGRTLVIGRELTKKFETISYLKIQDIPSWTQSGVEERGEFCLILGGAPKASIDPLQTDTEVLISLTKLAALMTPYLGSKQIAEIFSQSALMSKKAAYELALQVKTPPDGGA